MFVAHADVNDDDEVGGGGSDAPVTRAMPNPEHGYVMYA